jgi:hypothetical protein
MKDFLPKKRIIGSESHYFYQKGYDLGRLDVLNRLMQIADEGQYEDLRLGVVRYCEEHNIKL